MERRQQEIFGQKKWTQVSRMKKGMGQKKGRRRRSGTSIMATHAYRKNPEPTMFATEGHMNLQGSSRAQRERTLVASSRKQKWSRYAPVAFLTIILNLLLEKQCDASKRKGQENTTEETTIGGWIGRLTKEELYGGSDRLHQEKVKDLCVS